MWHVIWGINIPVNCFCTINYQLIPNPIICVAFLCIPVVLGLTSCSRNANLMKSIQYQLKLVENNDGNCDCSRGQPRENSGKVGFLATSSKHIQTKAHGAVVVYDTVTTNVGNGYNPSTGIFTAPSDGLYSFSWTTLSYRGKTFETNLFANKQIIARNYANSQSVSQHISGSQSVVIKLKKGDEVSIRSNGKGQYMYENKWSTFSGFKI